MADILLHSLSGGARWIWLIVIEPFVENLLDRRRIEMRHPILLVDRFNRSQVGQQFIESRVSR
jgi:hypothetical protein